MLWILFIRFIVITLIMVNRRATLEVYFVPEDQPGRGEATVYMKADGTFAKQNLLFTLWDLEATRATQTTIRDESSFYKVEFNDIANIHDRVQEIAESFGGTHSGRTSGYVDDASFRINRKGELIRYLESLRQSQSVESV